MANFINTLHKSFVCSSVAYHISAFMAINTPNVQFSPTIHQGLPSNPQKSAQPSGTYESQ